MTTLPMKSAARADEWAIPVDGGSNKIFKWLKRITKYTFLFFLIKGLAWLAISAFVVGGLLK
jgi:hypothetical protein